MEVIVDQKEGSFYDIEVGVEEAEIRLWWFDKWIGSEEVKTGIDSSFNKLDYEHPNLSSPCEAWSRPTILCPEIERDRY